jgi:hypothetical protein
MQKQQPISIFTCHVSYWGCLKIAYVCVLGLSYKTFTRVIQPKVVNYKCKCFVGVTDGDKPSFSNNCYAFIIS